MAFYQIYEDWYRDPPAVSSQPSYPRDFSSDRVDANFVLQQCVDNKAYQLVDARTSEQFNGATRRSSRGGHIPGASNVPYKSLLSTKMVEGKAAFKTFQTPQELVGTLQKAGVDPWAPSCVYCNGGVASTVIIFVLAHLGTKALNYDGSWNEWGTRSDLPVSST